MSGPPAAPPPPPAPPPPSSSSTGSPAKMQRHVADSRKPFRQQLAEAARYLDLEGAHKKLVVVCREHENGILQDGPMYAKKDFLSKNTVAEKGYSFSGVV